MFGKIKLWIRQNSVLYFILSTAIEVALIDIATFVIVNYFRSIWRLIGFGIGMTLILVSLQFIIYFVSLNKNRCMEE